MKGISYITNSKNQKTAVVIDLKILQNYKAPIEDLFDIIIANSRADEPSVSFETIKRKLKKSGKL